jgi:hypothetical protein
VRCPRDPTPSSARSKGSSVRRGFPLLLTTLATFFVGLGAAHAAPPQPLTVEVVPALGAGAGMGEGWTSFVVWLKNPRGAEVSGSIELVASPSWARKETLVRTRAPFALAAGAYVAVELPTHGFASTPAEFKLTVVDQNGEPLTASPVPVPDLHQGDPTLVDLSVPSRIAPALRGTALPLRRSGATYRAPSALVSSPPVDPATGDLVLPRWAAGYANATLVAASARRLAKIGQTELSALSRWVLSGGALAVALERPEDLRLDVLTRLAGGAIQQTAAGREVYGESTFFLGPEASQVPALRDPGGIGLLQTERRAPRPDIAQLLKGYSGGNLRPSPWGAVASYGLGELHLVAFELGEPFASDRWVTLKLADLLRHAAERQATIALPLGRTAFDGPGADAVRTLLDPNRTVRWTIVFAALLLLGYAVVAGPVSFWLASRKGRPLRALVHLPFWALGTLAAIVLLGLAGKGIRGRARHFTVVEAGAGMLRGTAVRFRGFYSPSSKDIQVRPTSRASLLDVAQGADFVERTLTVDRDGPRLSRLRTKPWSTVVAREDGFMNLAGGISLVLGPDGRVMVKNRAARDLVGAVLKVPGRNAIGFPRIKDGATVREHEGEAITSSLGATSSYTNVHPLGTALVKDELERYSEGLSRAWTALETQAGSVDFWPEDVPVLLAQLDGGEGTLEDSGFALDQDRVLVRVVGYGGVP